MQAAAHHDGPRFSESSRPHSEAARAETVLGMLHDDGVIVGWVWGADKLIGLTPQAAVGRRADFFLGPDSRLTVSAFAESLGSSAGWSNQVQTPDGKTASLRLSRLSGLGRRPAGC